MKISIVNVQAPFIRGGAEYLADSLAAKLLERGHRVAIVKIPFKWYPEEALLDHMLACRLLRIRSGDPDLVIALKFPAYLIPFKNRKVWLLHQFRQVYELWGTPWAGMPDDPRTRRIRDMIRNADTAALGSAKKLYTNSKMVADRLKRFNGIDADGILYPPLDRAELFHKAEAKPYFFYPSRLNTVKRQHVAIEAMRFVKSPFQLVLAGKADSDEYGEQLRALVETHGLADRVRFLGWISEEEKARWMSECLAAVYLPYDEDSYGYVTLEAFLSHKCVLTFSDSGGTNELIAHERNGLIVEPTPEALAEAMERAYANPARTLEMGDEAAKTPAELGIDWQHILDTLTA